MEGTLPPEVPPYRPPMPPTEPPPPGAPPGVPRQPSPVLPTWEEAEPRLREQPLEDRLLERRILMAGGTLDQALADHVTAQLLLLGRSRRPVDLHLACPDSELAPSLALADAIDLAGEPVHVYVRGTLGGPAVAVVCAAERRTAHRHAVFVLGVPRTTHVTLGRFEDEAEQHRRQVAQLVARIAETTGRGEVAVAEDLERHRLLSAEEALDYGLVQELR